MNIGAAVEAKRASEMNLDSFTSKEEKSGVVGRGSWILGHHGSNGANFIAFALSGTRRLIRCQFLCF